MPKHVCDENDDQAQGSPPKKVVKATSVCKYCDKMFTARGMPLHLRKCPQKQAHDKAQAKKTRAYKFTIVNENIHEEILSFLNNQALTKMQMITGDRYQQCEPELAQFCCKCENDNPVILHQYCRECASKRGWTATLTKRQAKDIYGVRVRDFQNISSEIYRYRYLTRYNLITLEEFMIEKCGSKMEWLRCVATNNKRKMKIQARRKQKEETNAFL